MCEGGPGLHLCEEDVGVVMVMVMVGWGSVGGGGVNAALFYIFLREPGMRRVRGCEGTARNTRKHSAVPRTQTPPVPGPRPPTRAFNLAWLFQIALLATRSLPRLPVRTGSRVDGCGGGRITTSHSHQSALPLPSLPRHHSCHRTPAVLSCSFHSHAGEQTVWTDYIYIYTQLYS